MKKITNKTKVLLMVLAIALTLSVSQGFTARAEGIDPPNEIGTLSIDPPNEGTDF